MKIIGVIPARYASTRFPGKPLADICGKPMIWWVYNSASKVSELDDVYVATDSEKIAEVCEQYDMKYIMTSENCPTGTDRVAEVAEKVDADIYVNIQGDEPLITISAIQELIFAFNDPKVYFATLKNKINDYEEISSENTVKVVSDKNDYALYFSRSIIPSGLKGYQGQIYRHIGIYAYTKKILLDFVRQSQSELELAEGVELLRAIENGTKIKIIETDYSGIGVDIPKDLEKVRNILNESTTS